MKRREYESVIVINPKLGEEGIRKIIEDFHELLRRKEAENIEIIHWGIRKLAYRIRAKPGEYLSEGYYVLFQFDAFPTAIADLEAHLRIRQGEVLRYLIVRRPKAKAPVPSSGEAGG